MRPRRLNLLAQFGALSAIAMLVLGVALFVNDRSMLRGESERLTELYGVATVNAVVPTLMQPEDVQNGLSPILQLQVLAAVQFAKESGTVRGLTIYDRKRKATFTDLPGPAGAALPRSKAADAAYAGKPGHVHVRDGASIGLPHGEYLAIYVPLRFAADPTVYGVGIIWVSYEPVQRALSDNLWRIVLIAGGGLALLWLLLFRIAASASRSLRRQSAENERLAREDALTGLPNRVRFFEEAAHALPEAARAGASAAVLIVDLDRFKEVNDALGHATGDELLRRVAPRLAATVGGRGTVARLGGDEFAVLLPRIGSLTEAADVAEALLDALAEPVALPDITVVVDGSIGIALHPRHGTLEEVLRCADVAMYAAKEANSGYAVYDEELGGSTPEQLALVTDLREAIAAGDQIVVEYQPKADAASGRVTGVEALVRWDCPKRGRVSPGAFVPLAEHTGLIKPLTSLVLDRALGDCRSWLDRGIELPVAVNISARRLVDLALPDEITGHLMAQGVPPELLELEITESAIMLDHGRSATILARLDDLGVRIAIDDFGTGYSSFAHLRRLPVSTIKIDRSFVAQMDTVGEDAAIVRSALALAQNLDLKVVAEGVESPRVWGQLSLLGCDEVQGYALSRSLPSEALLAWLAARVENAGGPGGPAGGATPSAR